MKLKKIVTLKGYMECVTGLCIKNSGSDLAIGGADSEVIKNPLTGEPYLPGSSLKGKMRSQLEKRDGNCRGKDPCGCGREDCLVCTLFGAHKNVRAVCGTPRLIVRDAGYTAEYRQKVAELVRTGGNPLEVKAENCISRDTGTAQSPRFIERVPAGAAFSFELKLQIFEGDEEDWLLNGVRDALKLVEESYLGGSGSRGYGQVKFHYDSTERML